MARELGGSQISALLESVPGIVNVLRSPVADAIVAMIRAGAGLENFRMDSAKELVQFAERRGLMSSGEGDRLLEEVAAAKPQKGGRRKATQGKPKKARAGKAKPVTPLARTKKPKTAAKKSANATKATKKPAKKSPTRKSAKKKPETRSRRR
jgi:hypothetical protein